MEKIMSAEDSTETNDKPFPWLLLVLALFGIAVTVGLILDLIHDFSGYHFLAGHTKWGTVGDFIGGVLNPIIGLLALFGLLYTIHQNQVELSQATKEMKRSSQALTDNNALAEKQSKKDELYRVISVIENGIETTLNKDIHLFIYKTNDSYRINSTVKEMLISTKTEQIEQSMDSVLSSLNELSVYLEEMSNYLSRYSKVQGDHLFEEYYRHKYTKIAKKLSHLNCLRHNVANWYQTTFRPEIGIQQIVTDPEDN